MPRKYPALRRPNPPLAKKKRRLKEQPKKKPTRKKPPRSPKKKRKQKPAYKQPAKRHQKQEKTGDDLTYRGVPAEKKQKLERRQRRLNRNRVKPQKTLAQEKVEIDRIKNSIVKRYGIEPTICFFYYLWNAVEYVGEDRVRASFASIKGQGDEVVIGDYGSTDRTKEIALEYGFKVVPVAKTNGIKFHETKIDNAIMWSTQCNFMIDLNINTVYPPNMYNFYKTWIGRNDITQKILVARGIFHQSNGRKVRDNSASVLFYRPFLIHFRGFDERTYYGFGATHYAYCLLVDILNLELDNLPLDLHHAYHSDFKRARWRKIFQIADPMREHDKMMVFVEDILDGYYVNVNEFIKNVHNSYW